ncbi:hypothetical protein [Pacificispira sp.]|jgi:hypothetical protein|uniref:hypothetical protein n=1 Tax=Pacificispira sp. TaxID=2888761 RepID=UPI003B523F1B
MGRPANGETAPKTKRRGETPLLPATFLKRGTYLPFTTSVLSYARLRRPTGGSLEILIPGLAGGAETYVIPYKVLPEVINLTVHDRALHEELAHLREISPSRIRQTANRVAMTGLGGPALAKRAKQERLADEEQPAMILLSLLRMAIGQLAPNHPGAKDLTERTIATAEGMKLARDALGGYAQSIGERGDKIYARLENWANRIAPVGSPDGNVAGYLMTLLVTLEGLAAELGKWLIQEPPETAEMAQRTVTAARGAAELARTHLKALDQMANNMAEPLRDFDNTEKKLKHHVEHMALMIDGWQRVIDMWNAARAGDRFLQRDTLEIFAQHLPILPEEAVGGQVEMWETLRQSQTRWGRTSQHRIDSDLDQDTKDKLSQFRKEP